MKEMEKAGFIPSLVSKNYPDGKIIFQRFLKVISFVLNNGILNRFCRKIIYS